MQHPPPPLSSDGNAGSRRPSGQLSVDDTDTVQMNGADAHVNGSDQPAPSEPCPAVKLMSRTDKDIVRLIGQHLQAIGLTYDLLTNEYVNLVLICFGGKVTVHPDFVGTASFFSDRSMETSEFTQDDHLSHCLGCVPVSSLFSVAVV